MCWLYKSVGQQREFVYEPYSLFVPLPIGSVYIVITSPSIVCLSVTLFASLLCHNLPNWLAVHAICDQFLLNCNDVHIFSSIFCPRGNNSIKMKFVSQICDGETNDLKFGMDLIRNVEVFWTDVFAGELAMKFVSCTTGCDWETTYEVWTLVFISRSASFWVTIISIDVGLLKKVNSGGIYVHQTLL